MQVEVASSSRAGTPFSPDAQLLSIFTAGWNIDIQSLFTSISINEDLDSFAMSEFALVERGMVGCVEIY